MPPRRARAPDPEIQELRRRIDALDQGLLDLLNQRLACARTIGDRKRTVGVPTFVAPREKQVLSRLLDGNPGPFPNPALIRIWQEIFSASRQAETPLKAAYPGPAGSLGHAAAAAIFGRSSTLHPVASPLHGLAEVARERADYAVLPALNTPEGVGSSALVHLLEYELHLVAEFFLPLEVSIAARPGCKAFSHLLVPPALADSTPDVLGGALPGATPSPAADTADAGRRAASERATAALVPPFTAEHFGLALRRRLLGPGEGRSIRYLVAARQSASPTGADKTTIAFGLVNRAGNLIRALGPFSRRKINLHLLTATPAGSATRGDLFFLDFDGHVESESTRRALTEMRKLCSFVEVLGSYPVFDMHARTRA